MIHLGNETARVETGFVVKHCVLCLTNRLHAVEVSNTEFVGFTYGAKAFLVCTVCGFEREVRGEAAKSVMETAVSRAAIEETLERGYIEGEFGDDLPAGIEWLAPANEDQVAA